MRLFRSCQPHDLLFQFNNHSAPRGLEKPCIRKGFDIRGGELLLDDLGSAQVVASSQTVFGEAALNQ